MIIHKEDAKLRDAIKRLKEVNAAKRLAEKEEKKLKETIKVSRAAHYAGADILTFVEKGVDYGVKFEERHRTSYLPHYDEDGQVTNAKVVTYEQLTIV